MSVTSCNSDSSTFFKLAEAGVDKKRAGKCLATMPAVALSIIGDMPLKIAGRANATERRKVDVRILLDMMCDDYGGDALEQRDNFS